MKYYPKEEEPTTTPGWELYDLERDPHELHNVYHDPAYADVRKDLKTRLAERKAALDDEDEQYPELVALKDEHW